MHLTNIAIHNYKSLKYIDIDPSPLSCIVGPNASGKSNFADAISFLGEVHEHGLEVAIARKGGYENIAFRRVRRSKSPISFSITFEGHLDEVPRTYFPQGDNAKDKYGASTEIRCSHTFSFSAKGQSIRAPFSIVEEQFESHFREEGKSWRLLFTLARDDENQIAFRTGPRLPKEIVERFGIALEILRDNKKSLTVSPQQLSLSHFFLGDFNPFTSVFTQTAAQFRVFRLTPETTRKEGVPTPNAELSFSGENLPGLVDWLQHNHQDNWQAVMSVMREVMPSLTSITTDYSPSKTLQLFFLEEKSGRPWIADDVSDGTIQTLAMLVAISDPRGTLLLIEEPENSIHPWIIRVLVDEFRKLSTDRTVFLTSHSRTLIDLLTPDELWIASRRNLETTIRPIVSYDSQIADDWRDGKYKLSEALDAGLIPAAVPGGIDE